MGKSFIDSLASFAASLRYEDLPQNVIEKAKICLLDFLGIAVGGYTMEASQLAIRATKRFSAPGRATVLIDGYKARAIDCVLANSVLAHSYLQDDWLHVSFTHNAVAVIPTVLALAEEHGHSCVDVILGIIVGYEIESRVGVLAIPTFSRGFRASGVYSYFGSAAAAAKLIGLSSQQFKNALGCAGSMAGGLLQPWIDGSMEWAFEEGFGCRGGILAAILAQEGLRGADYILEGRCGVNHCFAGTTEGQEKTLKGLGSDFHIVNTCFKPFPSGGVNQESIALAINLAQQQIDYHKIKAIRVKIPPTGTTERADYTGVAYLGPFETFEQCLVSKGFGIAAAIKNGSFNIDIARREYKNPELFELTQKIQFEQTEDGMLLCVEVELQDGTVFRGEGLKNILAHICLSSDMAREKFLKMASGRLGVGRSKQIIDLIFRMEELEDITPIIERMVV